MVQPGKVLGKSRDSEIKDHAMNLSYVVNVPALLGIILQRLGLTGTSIPRNSEGVFDGIELPCRFRNIALLVPNGTYTVKVIQGKGRQRSHRMHVQCKECPKWIPAGRLAQHMKIH